VQLHNFPYWCMSMPMFFFFPLFAYDSLSSNIVQLSLSICWGLIPVYPTDTKLLDLQIFCIKWHNICIEATHVFLYVLNHLWINLLYLIQSKCYVNSCSTVLFRE
jgi:hypothetical protein